MPAPRGNSYAEGNSGGGAPEGNQNAQSHGLYAGPEGYFGELDDGEQRWIVDMHQDLLDQYRRINGGEPDKFDTESLKNIAIDFHRVAGANGWFSEHGLVHDELFQLDHRFSVCSYCYDLQSPARMGEAPVS